MGKRYSIRDILISICEPSHSISEQFQASTVKLKNGGSLYGRIIYENEKEIAVATNPYNFSEINKTAINEVEKTEPSQLSMMPPGTIYGMNKDELMDLMAYLISGGDKKHQAFVEQ
ncbi:MAG: hypothetical protein HOI66_05825 [Verrucomicrobia bacterium]|nr:hypothetical protein [Verrucomicrobiota bacterium]